MKIHLATDHAGLDFKNYLKDHLIKKNYQVEDHGAHEYDALMTIQILFFHAQRLSPGIQKVEGLFLVDRDKEKLWRQTELKV